MAPLTALLGGKNHIEHCVSVPIVFSFPRRAMTRTWSFFTRSYHLSRKDQEVGLRRHLRHISVLHPEKVDIAIEFAGKNINFLS